MERLPDPDQSIRLYGTSQMVAPVRLLKAGPLSAELDGGNLRHVRFQGIEIMRAVSYVVRDRSWGTYEPEITDLEICESGDRFTVNYDAVVTDTKQSFRYRATITGMPDGLEFATHGDAKTDFVTNRTGFVVLHPIDGVVGQYVEIEHVDGTIVNATFPALIDPVQPMMDLRALTHEAAPGLRVHCRMEGDTFEMEDQRNWTDASYKTYVRPLSMPWPYTLAAGTKLKQEVTLAVSGAPLHRLDEQEIVSIVFGDAKGTAPSVGLGLDPDNFGGTKTCISELAQLGAQHLICHFDPRRGHDAETLRDAVGIAASLGTTPWLEAVLNEVDGFADELSALGKVVADMGSPFPVVLISPAPDLKCTLPGSAWPLSPPPIDLFRAARGAFPEARIGGGMFSFFTELNRKRPPIGELDFVSFTTSALVHAGDDHSVMEGLESLPAIAASASVIAQGLPLAVGPSAIGMRMNPYGDAPTANPGNIRQAMNYNDPRQRGLLGAAWVTGYFARLAPSLTAIAIGGTTGAHGLVYTPEPWPAPWYDVHGGLYPCFHVMRVLASMAGNPLCSVQLSSPNEIQAVCISRADGYDLLVANLKPQALKLTLPVVPSGVAVLNEDSFVEASRTPDFLDRLSPPTEATLRLGSFAVARIRF